MKDWVVEEDDFLHVGADWERKYIVEGVTFDPIETTAMCKIRDRKDNLLVEATCTIGDNYVLVRIGYNETLGIDKRITKGRYDVFVGFNNKSYKLCMGNIDIIHDISMH